MSPQNQIAKFQPKRLTQARKAKKWNQSELAERVDLTRQAISSYEKIEGTRPTPENVRNLAKWLDVPEHFFYLPLRQSEEKLESAINFRSLKSAQRKAREQALPILQWTVSMLDFASEVIEKPAVDLPEFDIKDFMKISLDDVEELATKTRRHFGLGDGPIPNITKLLENKGVLVTKLPLDKGMDGFSAWFNKTPVIVINSNAYYARSRFDLCHELFHLLAHKDVVQEDLEDKEILNTIERQAHRFANAFIAPASTFLNEVYALDLESFVSLKARWGISVQAIIQKLYDLRLISEHQRTRLFTSVNVRKWRRKEPLDGEIEPEKPTFIEKLSDLFAEHGVLSKYEFIHQLGLPQYYLSNHIPIAEQEVGMADNVIQFRSTTK